MSDKPTNPYAGLDKFLLGDTRAKREAEQPPTSADNGVAELPDRRPATAPLSPTRTAQPTMSSPTPVQPGVETRKHANKQTRLHAKPDSPASLPKLKSVDADKPDGADLLKYSVYFTQVEIEDLEDLKIALRRKNGLTCTKYNIVRHAFLDMLEDYTAHGDDSRLVQRLRKASE